MPAEAWWHTYGWMVPGWGAWISQSTKPGPRGPLTCSTEDLSHITQSGQQGFGLNTTNDSKVVIFGGGIPIKRDGVVIGAVGASGGSVEQDVTVARAALAGF